MGGGAGRQHGQMRIVAHDLHLHDIAQKIPRAGPVFDRNRQMIEADVAPGAIGFRDRFGEGLDAVDTEMIDQIAKKVVRIDLAAISGAKNQPMTGGELGRQRDMKGLMNDRAAPHGMG